MVGDNPRRDKFFQTLKNTGGKATSGDGMTSGLGPARYTVDGPTQWFYDAQHKLLMMMNAQAAQHRDWVPVAPDVYFDSIDNMQQWVDGITAMDWSHVRAGPPQHVRVVLHTPRTFQYVSGRILAPRDRPLAWQGIHLVHELAHHYGEPLGHGLVFVRVMLTLVETIYGTLTADSFKRYLTEQGVQT